MCYDRHIGQVWLFLHVDFMINEHLCPSRYGSVGEKYQQIRLWAGRKIRKRREKVYDRKGFTGSFGIIEGKNQ
jgi:hypothetical protein